MEEDAPEPRPAEAVDAPARPPSRVLEWAVAVAMMVGLAIAGWAFAAFLR